MKYRYPSPNEPCSEFEADLVLYYYGELARSDRGRVESHLKSCSTCGHFLKDLGSLLPRTVKGDEPPEGFWEDYSREIRKKLAAAAEEQPWWKGFFLTFRSWPMPALATALILIIALTLTFRKKSWRPTDIPPDQEALLEVLPIAENLDFFKAMELLDSMDLLEAAGGPANGSA